MTENQVFPFSKGFLKRVNEALFKISENQSALSKQLQYCSHRLLSAPRNEWGVRFTDAGASDQDGICASAPVPSLSPSQGNLWSPTTPQVSNHLWFIQAIFRSNIFRDQTCSSSVYTVLMGRRGRESGMRYFMTSSNVKMHTCSAAVAVQATGFKSVCPN